MDFSKIIALPIWFDVKTGCPNIVVFNPWGSRNIALTSHIHRHTKWAENIHLNVLAGTLCRPAKFNWHDKVVYIVGRGASLKQSKHILERPRSNPAIFLNHSLAEVKHQEGDFALICDSAVQQVNGWQNKVGDLSLLTFPGIHSSVLRLPWVDVYSFVFWTMAPLNDWMRREYPFHPQVSDTLMISTMAIHLCALNGAKAVVLVGQDYTTSNGALSYVDHLGIEVTTEKCYALGAMAVSGIARFCNHHTGMRIINVSGGIAGVNLFPKPDAKKPDLFKCFEFNNMEEVYEEFENATESY